MSGSRQAFRFETIFHELRDSTGVGPFLDSLGLHAAFFGKIYARYCSRSSIRCSVVPIARDEDHRLFCPSSFVTSIEFKIKVAYLDRALHLSGWGLVCLTDRDKIGIHVRLSP
jgi:hypothetical protein